MSLLPQSKTPPRRPDGCPARSQREGAIATLRFSRPEAMNAIDVPMAQALLAAVQGLAADPGVRAVVLCGAGKAFMAGGDLATLRADPVQGAADLLGPLNAAVLTARQHERPRHRQGAWRCGRCGPER
jgi:2-(1,2-epoxy-1,2-dihydrophenyl)acetyl-CoA isomerase